MKKEEPVQPAADASLHTPPLSETIENAHAAGDGALSKSDEALPQNEADKENKETPAY